MKLRIECAFVEKYASGPREGEFRAFALPKDAQIVHVSFVFNKALIYYVVPA